MRSSHNEVDAQLGVLFAERLDHRGEQTRRHPLRTGHLQRSRQFLPLRHQLPLELPLERLDGSLDIDGVWEQRFAEFGESVAGRVMLDKLAADAFLERGEAPLHRRLADAKRFRRRKRAAFARDRQQVAQVVPVKHRLVQHFCWAVEQSCGCRTHPPECYAPRTVADPEQPAVTMRLAHDQASSI